MTYWWITPWTYQTKAQIRCVQQQVVQTPTKFVFSPLNMMALPMTIAQGLELPRNRLRLGAPQKLTIKVNLYQKHFVLLEFEPTIVIF